MRSGYNNGEIASVFFPVGRSNPNEDAISPRASASIPALASGAIAVSLVYVLGTQRMIYDDNTITIGKVIRYSFLCSLIFLNTNRKSICLAVSSYSITLRYTYILNIYGGAQ